MGPLYYVLVAKQGRPSKWGQHQDTWVQLYQERKWSCAEIARESGSSVQTVSRILTEAGVTLERRVRNPNAGRTPEEQARINAKVSASRKGKGTGPRVPRETLKCDYCGTSYVHTPGKSGIRFCSRTCNIRQASQDKMERVQAAYREDPKRCPCGHAIPYEHRHHRQFCSPEHRSRYQAKRQKDPANYRTFTCMNCGESVTRLKGSGQHRYCSNDCAQKHTRTKKHIVVKDAVVLDSVWETVFWGWCEFHKLPVERFERKYAIEWRKGCWYAPDFWLPTLEMAVEVKGLEDNLDQERWSIFRQHHRLVVVGREELKAMGATTSLGGTLKALAS